MQTKFKRHAKVRLLVDADSEYVEYHNAEEELENPVKIKKGMEGKINMILPNGRYHVEIIDKKGNTVAYVPLDEESLEEIN